MRVDGPGPAPTQVLHNPLKEAGRGGFANILRQVAGENIGGRNAAKYAAAIVPQIGDSAISFSERPMVLLVALEFDHLDQMFENEGDLIGKGGGQAPEGYPGRLIASIGMGVEQHSEWGRLAVYIPGARAQVQADVTPCEGALTPVKPAAMQTLPRSVAGLATLTAGPMRKEVKMSEVVAQVLEAVPAKGKTERAGSHATILANLLAVENGFRLVLRTPTMRADEHLELMRRLDGLFVEHGRNLTELLIYHPTTTD